MLRHHALGVHNAKTSCVGVHNLLVAELFVLGVRILLTAEMSCVGCSSSLNCSGRQSSVAL